MTILEKFSSVFGALVNISTNLYVCHIPLDVNLADLADLVYKLELKVSSVMASNDLKLECHQSACCNYTTAQICMSSHDRSGFSQALSIENRASQSFPHQLKVIAYADAHIDMSSLKCGCLSCSAPESSNNSYLQNDMSFG